jgi:hypothetical protein
MTEILNMAEVDNEQCSSLSSEAEAEFLCDRACEMVRAAGSDDAAMAIGIERNGVTQIATACRDPEGGLIHIDLWNVPRWNLSRFAAELQCGRLS